MLCFFFIECYYKQIFLHICEDKYCILFSLISYRNHTRGPIQIYFLTTNTYYVYIKIIRETTETIRFLCENVFRLILTILLLKMYSKESNINIIFPKRRFSSNEMINKISDSFYKHLQ